MARERRGGTREAQKEEKEREREREDGKIGV